MVGSEHSRRSARHCAAPHPASSVEQHAPSVCSGALVRHVMHTADIFMVGHFICATSLWCIIYPALRQAQAEKSDSARFYDIVGGAGDLAWDSCDFAVPCCLLDASIGMLSNIFRASMLVLCQNICGAPMITGWARTQVKRQRCPDVLYLLL